MFFFFFNFIAFYLKNHLQIHHALKSGSRVWNQSLVNLGSKLNNIIYKIILLSLYSCLTCFRVMADVIIVKDKTITYTKSENKKYVFKK